MNNNQDFNLDTLTSILQTGVIEYKGKKSMKQKHTIKVSTLLFLSLFLFIISSCSSTPSHASSNEEGNNIDYENAPPPITIESSSAINTAVALQQAIREVAKNVSPSVVSIKADIKLSSPGMEEFFNDPFFRFFFGEPPSQQQEQVQQVLGTGFIFHPDGYIITNNHVVENAESILISLLDKREFEATVIGRDPEIDLAVVKIKDEKAFSYVRFGNSDKIEVGDLAIAIGNPFGLAGSLTFGVISAKGRMEVADPQKPYTSYIQTDAPINRGNSGGPLLNIYGQIVGVNTIILSQTGGNIGIGFAIPANIARNSAEQILKHGKVTRGFLGVGIDELDKETAEYLDVEGVIVRTVTPDGPADKAGIKQGDVILTVNTKPILNPQGLIVIIANMAVGEEARLEILRNNKKKTITVRIESRDDFKEEKNPKLNEDHVKWLGLSIGQKLIEMQNGQKKKILYILESERKTGPRDFVFRQGDIIVAINNTEITTLEAFRSFIQQTSSNKEFLIHVVRQGASYLIVIPNE